MQLSSSDELNENEYLQYRLRGFYKLLWDFVEVWFAWDKSSWSPVKALPFKMWAGSLKVLHTLPPPGFQLINKDSFFS